MGGWGGGFSVSSQTGTETDWERRQTALEGRRGEIGRVQPDVQTGGVEKSFQKGGQIGDFAPNVRRMHVQAQRPSSSRTDTRRGGIKKPNEVGPSLAVSPRPPNHGGPVSLATGGGVSRGLSLGAGPEVPPIPLPSIPCALLRRLGAGGPQAGGGGRVPCSEASVRRLFHFTSRC